MYPKRVEMPPVVGAVLVRSAVIGLGVAVAWPRPGDAGEPHVEVPTYLGPPVVQVAAVTTTSPSGWASTRWG
jgi:hypothetical protein